MDITYKIVAADGAQYGPVPLNQILVWAQEGRITPETQVWRSDGNTWLPAGRYTELGMAEPAAVSAPLRPPAPMLATPNVDPALERHVRSGAGWFFWIAGLSLINSFIALGGRSGGFILGLGVTQILDAMGGEFGTNGRIIVLLLNFVVAGIFVMFGVFGRKRHTWSFITGMVLYALDGLIYLLAADWLGVGFHIFALFCIFRGLQANLQLNALARTR